MVASAAVFSLLLFLFFERTFSGKALRATSINRTGARIVGIRAGKHRHARLLFSLRCSLPFRNSHQPGDDALLRFRFSDWTKGFCRRDHRRPVQLSRHRDWRACRRPSRKLRFLLEQLTERGDCLWRADSRSVVAIAVTRHKSTRKTKRSRDEPLDRLSPDDRRDRLLAMAPFWAAEFTITLLNYIGIYALVVLGLVLLTGVGGLTSFGQAAFVGIGAYATAWLTTVYGVSPWLGLFFALAVTGAIAASLGAVTLRARRTLPAARHHRLGAVDLLSVRQYRCTRRPQRPDRRTTNFDRPDFASNRPRRSII